MEFPVKKKWTGIGYQVVITFDDYYSGTNESGDEVVLTIPCTDYRWVDVENEENTKWTEVFNSDRGDGGSTSYYKLPSDAKELGDLIYHKEMNHSIGEAFCALYRLKDNGEYARNLRKAKYYIDLELSRVDG